MNSSVTNPLVGTYGGRILDVATGGGQFLVPLTEWLSGYDEIIGLDSGEAAAARFNAATKDMERVSFVRGDALHAPFPHASFDLVTISNSLHHFDDPDAVLVEAMRLVRKGGLLAVSEMHCDAKTNAQMTHVLMHRFWANVDSAKGVVHHGTFPRDGLIALFGKLGLDGCTVTELPCDDGDPKDPGLVEEIESVHAQYRDKADGITGLLAEADSVHSWFLEHGFASAPSVLMVGRKPKTSPSVPDPSSC